MSYLRIKIFVFSIIFLCELSANKEPSLGRNHAYDLFERVPEHLKLQGEITLEVVKVFDQIVLLPNNLDDEIPEELSEFKWVESFIKNIYGLYPSFQEWNNSVIWDEGGATMNENDYALQVNQLSKLIEETNYKVGVCFIIKCNYFDEEVLVIGLNLRPEFDIFPMISEMGQGCISFPIIVNSDGSCKHLQRSRNGDGHLYNHMIFNDQKSILNVLNDMELVSLNPYRWAYLPAAID